MLTRRGYALLGIVVVAEIMGVLFGSRAINAVVAPGIVALLFGWLKVRNIKKPQFERDLPETAFEGESVEAVLSFDTHSSFAARVVDSLGEGIAVSTESTREGVSDSESGDDTFSVETTVSDSSEGRGDLVYKLQLKSRGVRKVGPLKIVASDLLGLFEKEFKYDEESQILVFPRVYKIKVSKTADASSEEGDIFDLVSGDYGLLADSREGFDELREYESGDTLRDIHWKVSAKETDDDLIVKEFVATNRDTNVEMSIVAEDGREHDAVRAGASVVSHLVGRGFSLGVFAENGRVMPDTGEGHLYEILALLARTGSGKPEENKVRRSEIVVKAGHDGDVRVSIEGYEFPFSRFAGFELSPRPDSHEPRPGELPAEAVGVKTPVDYAPGKDMMTSNNSVSEPVVRSDGGDDR